jgi:hypothetical protein
MTIQVRDAMERGRYIISSHRVFDQGKEQSYSVPSKCGFFRDNAQLRIALVPPSIRTRNVGQEREEMFSAHEPIRKGPYRF